MEVPEPVHPKTSMVAIDLGVSKFATVKRHCKRFHVADHRQIEIYRTESILDSGSVVDMDLAQIVEIAIFLNRLEATTKFVSSAVGLASGRLKSGCLACSPLAAH
jgi:hypothetical protein